ncbi:hypothetical protein SAMN05421553_4289 [Pseudomonas anguilliseptica]|uniref:Uncharacterized protein n=1 Tax=Pseudomonas anguilliseptica TaxID=53406 RepID=A0A1H5H1C2_PSEAG|nr:hypothetical protein SAMN05421553_4289 [Pseudomonas anguilliseptica]
MQGQYLVDLLFNAVQRIQRGHGLLKDHGDAVAANAAQFVLAQLEQVLPCVVNAAAGVLGQRVGQQTQDGMRGDRFARAAFAHQSQGLTALDIEADAFQYTLFQAAGDEFDRQVADFDEAVGVGHVISSDRRHRVPLRR